MIPKVGIERLALWPKIDLKNPQLGSELLKDPRGDLPVQVWIKYIFEHKPGNRTTWRWCQPPDQGGSVPIKPQEAVDQALPLVEQILDRLGWGAQSEGAVPIAEVFPLASSVLRILIGGASSYRRKRGQPAYLRPLAVRAYIIQKFNPTVRWANLADMLFIENGKCTQKIKDEDAAKKNAKVICGLGKHHHDSPCVKDLQTAVRRLKDAMKVEGIPI